LSLIKFLLAFTALQNILSVDLFKEVDTAVDLNLVTAFLINFYLVFYNI